MIEQAGAIRQPALLVVDDVDRAPAEVTDEIARATGADHPLLVLATAEQAAGATLMLGPLAPAAIEAIAREYAEAPPLEPSREGERGRPAVACTARRANGRASRQLAAWA